MTVDKKDRIPTLPVFAAERLRTNDGPGVTTLVTSMGCPLRCRLCINPQSWREGTRMRRFTPRELYDAVKVDDLYFQATGGGVTFGGGEPLLHMDFIEAFKALCPGEWALRAETCLNLEQEAVARAAKVIDGFIVDVKDTDPDIYRHYTGGEAEVMLGNLRFLLKEVGAERITARLPLIPGYNTEEDRAKSVVLLKGMGVKHFDLFEYIDPATRETDN